ncbi:unnamed protein product [Peronospora belbahrii]|uniref:EGF-like domain-containing protein n=1 Tax=Peronospora belbahrii TaxID=622444 RepID=A0AAU9L5W1_9STRA|nr:unnamed protein product [Peronospora belbahrii]
MVKKTTRTWTGASEELVKTIDVVMTTKTKTISGEKSTTVAMKTREERRNLSCVTKVLDGYHREWCLGSMSATRSNYVCRCRLDVQGRECYTGLNTSTCQCGDVELQDENTLVVFGFAGGRNNKSTLRKV